MDILLIPGFMLDADLWADIHPGLMHLGRVLDADTSKDDSIEAMADRAAAMLQGPSVVIGFSMGGHIARMIAYRNPKVVDRIALVATSSHARPSARTSDSVRGMFKGVSTAAIESALHPKRRSKELVLRVQQMSQRLGGAVFERQSRMNRSGDTARLSEIRCPALIIAAAQDQLRPMAQLQEMHELIPQSKLKVIEDCGHLLPLEQPSHLLNSLAGFINSGPQ